MLPEITLLTDRGLRTAQVLCYVTGHKGAENNSVLVSDSLAALAIVSYSGLALAKCIMRHSAGRCFVYCCLIVQRTGITWTLLFTHVCIRLH
jgi:hypothetical protein